MHAFVQYFLRHCHILVVAIVSHWNHRCRRQSPSKAARAHLSIKLVEKLFVNSVTFEYIWVLPHASFHFLPVGLNFFFVLASICCYMHVLGLKNLFFRPVTEKLDIWHQINVRLPETVIAQAVLVQQVQSQSELLPVTFFFR